MTAASSWELNPEHEEFAKFGTPEQKPRYRPALIAGEKLAAVAVTEPGTGSNVGGITTRVTPDGGGYRLDGTKGA